MAPFASAYVVHAIDSVFLGRADGVTGVRMQFIKLILLVADNKTYESPQAPPRIAPSLSPRLLPGRRCS